jgi:hypothetical protein
MHADDDAELLETARRLGVELMRRHDAGESTQPWQA